MGAILFRVPLELSGELGALGPRRRQQSPAPAVMASPKMLDLICLQSVIYCRFGRQCSVLRFSGSTLDDFDVPAVFCFADLLRAFSVGRVVRLRFRVGVDCTGVGGLQFRPPGSAVHQYQAFNFPEADHLHRLQPYDFRFSLRLIKTKIIHMSCAV